MMRSPESRCSHEAEVKELTGREGKVIDSGPDDDVFVAVSNHGFTGSIDMSGHAIIAENLNNAFE